MSWLNRGTLHLVRAEDHAWLFALTTPRLATGNARRLEQEGVSAREADRAVRLVVREAGGGPVTRAALRERLRVEGQALVLAADWLPRARPVPRDRALAELGRRYLAGHRPADARDPKWAGFTLADARTALPRPTLCATTAHNVDVGAALAAEAADVERFLQE